MRVTVVSAVAGLILERRQGKVVLGHLLGVLHFSPVENNRLIHDDDVVGSNDEKQLKILDPASKKENMMTQHAPLARSNMLTRKPSCESADTSIPRHLSHATWKLKNPVKTWD